MKRPILVALLSLAALAVVAAWGLEQRNNLFVTSNLLNNEYQRSFFSTVAQVQSLEVLLGKALVGRGGQDDVDLLAQTWQEALLAQRDLTQLPVQQGVIARTSTFLNQTAAFTNMLLRQAAGGQTPSEEQWATLRKLHEQAGKLNTQLLAVERSVEEDGARFWDIGRELRARRGALRPAPPRPAEDQLDLVNRQVEEFPTLVYDGPFSDHLERREPRAATGPTITADEARRRALNAVDRPNETLRARVVATTGGSIPSYRVEVTDRQDRNAAPILVDVARRGGEVVTMVENRTPGAPRISISEARQRAEKYLEQRKPGEMVALASEQQGRGAVIFNFAPRQDGVILYTDVMKVSVALDNGRVTGLNALDYVMFHQPRQIPAPALSAAEAIRRLNPDFKVSDSRLVLIPTEGGNEVLAWELRGETAGNTYLVYINAENGHREKILQVVETPEGTFTM